jgi:cephalosporin hydroxylase
MDIDQIVAESRASQNPKELKALLTELAKKPPKVILEIGVHKGYSLEVWHKAFPDAQIIGVENDPHELDPEAIGTAMIVDGDSHDEDTVYDVSNLLFRGEQVDFLFIDGDHTYEGVKKDFEMYKPLVKKGGFIGLHDVWIQDNEGVKVWKFWEEIASTYAFNRITFHFEGGTGTGLIFL